MVELCIKNSLAIESLIWYNNSKTTNKKVIMLTHEQKELEQNIILLEKKVASLEFSLEIQRMQLPHITPVYRQTRAAILAELTEICFVIDRTYDALEHNQTVEQATDNYNEDARTFPGFPQFSRVFALVVSAK